MSCRVHEGYMKPMTRFKVFCLGAINGLIVGLVLEKARIAYLNYQMSQAAREYAQTDYWVDFIEARWNPFVPLVCIAVFAIVSYLVLRILLESTSIAFSDLVTARHICPLIGIFDVRLESRYNFFPRNIWAYRRDLFSASDLEHLPRFATFTLGNKRDIYCYCYSARSTTRRLVFLLARP